MPLLVSKLSSYTHKFPDSDILNKTPDEVIVADELDVKPVEARLEEMNVRIDQKSRLIESLSKMIVENCETKYASCSTLHTSGNQLISPYHTTSMVIQTGGSAGVKKSMKCASSVNLSTRNLEDKKELTGRSIQISYSLFFISCSV